MGAENGHLIAGINVGGVKKQNDEQAEAGGKKRAEERMSGRPFESRRRLNVDLRFGDFFLLRDFDKRIDERLELLVLLEFFQVVLREVCPRHAFVFAFADFDLDALIVGRSGQQLAGNGVTIVELEDIRAGGGGEKPANE